jgi:hypothetical protein
MKAGRVAVMSMVLMAVGTGLTVLGSPEGMSLLVVAGVAVITGGLWLLRPMAQEVIHWLDRRGL